MKVRFESGALVLTFCALYSCRSVQPPVAREALVGSYVYKSEDPEGTATDHTWDRLVLQADGRYDLIEGGPTKPKSETVGAWTTEPSEASGQVVVLGNAGYPVRVEGSDVRLLIDDDVGIWYQKVR